MEKFPSVPDTADAVCFCDLGSGELVLVMLKPVASTAVVQPDGSGHN